MCPTFFAEISCITSPVPGVPFCNDIPRIICLGEQIGGMQYSPAGEEPAEQSPHLRIRELELINGFHKYDIRIGAGRHFISFKGLSIAEPLEFYKYAKTEVARINRVLNSIYPSAAKVILSDTICIAENDTTLQPYWREDVPVLESVETQVAKEQAVVDNWNSFLMGVLEDRSKAVFKLFDLEESDAVVAACIALISQNTFPAFYNAYEIIMKEYGGKSEFMKIGPFSKRDISDFTDNAQATRHANYSIGCNTKPMGIPEAKFLVISLLNFYIQDRCKDESLIAQD